MARSRLLRRLSIRILRILLYSQDSQHRIALGAAVGVFWGMTPTVGLQILLVGSFYSISLFLERVVSGRLHVLRFNFPLAIALTWISNPLNAPFLYFIFYLVGAAALPYGSLGYSEFIALLSTVFEAEGMRQSLDAFLVLMHGIGLEIAIPTLVGSLVLAIPFSIFSYFIFFRLAVRVSGRSALAIVRRAEALRRSGLANTYSGISHK
ncbi:MAG: DUF2062 domain-containing protein [Planctomycetes bacterium]|nr:DUF2062 domain-containing protein [Planctomycetota bacterium]